MENEESKDTFTFPSSTDIDLSGGYEYDYNITGAAGTDVITISEPDYSIDYTTMNSGLTTTLSTTITGPMGPPGPTGPVGSIYIGSGSGGISGSTLTSTGFNGTSWVSNGPRLSVAGQEYSATIEISGKNPKLKTDETEIDINELSGVVEAIKQIMDTNELPIFDRVFRDKHEILQKSWEDVKQAYENYRITEALLKSTPPGDDDDQ